MPTQTWRQLKELLAQADEEALDQIRTINVEGQIYDSDAVVNSENEIEDTAVAP